MRQKLPALACSASRIALYESEALRPRQPREAGAQVVGPGMKQSVPWSVKGVEADARETAKELARRSGMTLGQWLNAMIAEQNGEDGFVRDAASPAATRQPDDPYDTLSRRSAEAE